MTKEPLIVDFCTEFSKNPIEVEIKEGMEPRIIELEKGAMIRFRDDIVTVSEDSRYEVTEHGVKQL